MLVGYSIEQLHRIRTVSDDRLPSEVYQRVKSYGVLNRKYVTSKGCKAGNRRPRFNDNGLHSSVI